VAVLVGCVIVLVPQCPNVPPLHVGHISCPFSRSGGGGGGGGSGGGDRTARKAGKRAAQLAKMEHKAAGENAYFQQQRQEATQRGSGRGPSERDLSKIEADLFETHSGALVHLAH
jgi:hypothetical protein